MDTAKSGNSRESLLQDFVDWAARCIRGDEKGEAQIFLDRLFRAFAPAGATRLFIGTMDENGWWWDNVGNLTFTVVQGNAASLVR